MGNVIHKDKVKKMKQDYINTIDELKKEIRELKQDIIHDSKVNEDYEDDLIKENKELKQENKELKQLAKDLEDELKESYNNPMYSG